MGRDAKKRYQRGMRLVLGSGAIAVAGIGGYLGYWFFFNANTQAISVQAIAIERGEVVKSVPAGGIVQLGDQQSLKVPTSADRAAIVEAIAVSVNSPITEGQILVQLRDPEGQTQVNEQRLQIQKQQLALEEKERAILQAQAALDLAKNDLQIQQQNNSAIRKAESDRDRAQEKIKEQQIELEALQVELESTRDLVKQGYLAANEQRTQEQSVRTTEATLRDYEKNLQQAELDLKNQRLTEQQNLKQLQEKIRIQEIALEDARSAVQTSRRDLEREQINLIKSEQNFEKNSLIRATTTGRVLDINVKPGEVLKQDSILLTIGDPRREEVKIRLNTLQAASVKINQPAIVSAIGLISGSFPGQVKELGRVALEDTNTSQSRGGSQNTVKAVVVLNRPSETLIPGSQVSVDIIIDRQANAIALPPQFIQDSDGKNPYVWILSDSGIAERREIELGLVGDTSTEVKTGLEPGEQVVSPPPDGSIEEGMKLMPIIDEQQITDNE